MYVDKYWLISQIDSYLFSVPESYTKNINIYNASQREVILSTLDLIVRLDWHVAGDPPDLMFNIHIHTYISHWQSVCPGLQPGNRPQSRIWGIYTSVAVYIYHPLSSPFHFDCVLMSSEFLSPSKPSHYVHLYFFLWWTISPCQKSSLLSHMSINTKI